MRWSAPYNFQSRLTISALPQGLSKRGIPTEEEVPTHYPMPASRGLFQGSTLSSGTVGAHCQCHPHRKSAVALVHSCVVIILKDLW